MIDINSTKLTDLITWLNSLRSVTDFEMPALSKIKDVCTANNIQAKMIGGGLLIGNPSAQVVFMAHVDRVGLIAINGKIEEDSIIDLTYVAKLSKLNPKSIKERFSKTLLVGYSPQTGEDLFIASLLDEDTHSLNAKIFCVIKSPQESISVNNPIPVTAIKPSLTQIDDYLQGYFDNSAGLAISIAAVAKHPEKLSCIITVAEEGGGYKNYSAGGRGAQEYIKHHDPEKILVVIDVRPAKLTETDSGKNSVGMGVVLREAEFRKNNNGNPKMLLKADEEVLNFVKEFSKQNNIRYQLYSGSGVTEAGRAFESLNQDTKLRCIWLQPPIVNEHSQFEIVSLTDIEGTLKIAEGLSAL